MLLLLLLLIHDLKLWAMHAHVVLPSWGKVCAERFTLWGQARRFLTHKARGLKVRSNVFAHTPSGRFGPPLGMHRHAFHGQGTPHLRIFLRRKPIQINAVKVSIELLEHVLHTPNAKRQMYKTVGQRDAMKPRCESPVMRQKLFT